MSANLDLVRSIFAAWELGDWSSTDWAHPELEFDIPDGPEPGVRVGVAAMAASWQQWLSAWEGYRIEAEEFRELDEERVFVLTRYGGRGKTSRLEIGDAGGTKAATLFHLRDGKVIRLVGYNNREQALADVGLAPEGE